MRFLGLPSLVRANGDSTNGTFGLVEQWDIPPGFVTPYHMHRLEDESFYILEGEVNFVCDGKWISAMSGDFVFGPRMIPHGFKVVGDTPARMLIFASPSGFENFLTDLSVPIDDFSPTDMAKLMELAAKYQIDILGPLPE
ncbi:MAG: cupin domain-containing protein [Acidobacteria bacterium]|nr:cupin domain-containing protein [Acidobacteriota bacterium]